MTFDQFLRGAADLCDIDWRKYRRSGPRRAVGRRLVELGLVGYDDYLSILMNDTLEAEALSDRMRVTVSRFFRERVMWDYLFQCVVPSQLEAREGTGPFRVWSAGCCSGEEPYTFAILWNAVVANLYPGLSLEIHATDLDSEVLTRAAKACYDRGSLREIPDTIRERWFEKKGGRWCLRVQQIRGVVFERLNLQEERPPGPGAFDIVLCRYLAFTYFHGERLFRVAEKLHDALLPGGVLVTGRKEGLGLRELALFRPWKAAAEVPDGERQRGADCIYAPVTS